MSAVVPTSILSIAHADTTTTCTGPTQIFAALPDGSTRRYNHTDPVGGTAGMTNLGEVGGPNGGTMMGGPNGDVYNIQPAGEFRRYHWNGTGWDPYQVIGQGWTNWDNPTYHNRITVDSRGDIYEVPSDGNLYVDHYDPAAGQIVRHEIDTNWGNYDLILAAGPGVLFARNPSLNNGELYRYQYDANSQRWLQRQKDVSYGWNIYSGMFSPGGDILYGHVTDSHGDLYWYNYDNATNGGTVGNDIDWGWDPSWLITSTSNTCATPMSLPPKAQVTPTSGVAATLLPNANGRLEYYYVGKDGTVVTIDQSNISDNSTAQFSTLAGTGSFTGRVAAGLNDNGGAQVLALGTDSETRNATQPGVGGVWSSLSPAGGYFPAEPAIVRKPDNTLVAYGLDAQGNLWYRPQYVKNGDLTAWLKVKSTGMKGTLTAVVQGNATRLFALDANNRLNTATVTGTTVSAWTTLTGLTSGTLAAAVPSVVVRSDGTAQVFALDASDNTVRTIKQNADLSWPTTWTIIPGLTAAGAPSALVTTSGTVEVVVKSSDGHIYDTGQIAVGNPAFRAWSAVDPLDKAASDPSSALLTTGTWVVVFRDANDRTLLFRAVPNSPQARATITTAAPSFVGGPLPAPKR
ncbi:tachylectin-related carbohydrate-binding protein [Kutzneria buriramensis]|nr:tachylectin-related carbohydrate-binding protein [Kutzneria buriramensis]